MDNSDPKVNLICLADDTVLIKVISHILLLHLLVDRTRLRMERGTEVNNKYGVLADDVATYKRTTQIKPESRSRSKLKSDPNNVIFPSPLFINISIYSLHRLLQPQIGLMLYVYH